MDSPRRNGDGRAASGDGAAAPSLLRIGLTAGFASLSPDGAVPGRDGAGADGGGGKIDLGSLSSPAEDEAVRSVVERARIEAASYSSGIGDGGGGFGGDGDDGAGEGRDPRIVAALSALGEHPLHSHSARGVLVNVIDPTTPVSPSEGGGGSGGGGGGGSHYAPPPPAPALPPNHNLDTPPGAAAAKGIFQFAARGATSASDGSGPGGSGDASSGASATNLRVHARLASTFAQNYDAALRSLPYVHPRTGARRSVSSLPVRLGLRTRPVTDPAEWHDGPYCHVYVAAAEGLEHYRAKVRCVATPLSRRSSGARPAEARFRRDRRRFDVGRRSLLRAGQTEIETDSFRLESSEEGMAHALVEVGGRENKERGMRYREGVGMGGCNSRNSAVRPALRAFVSQIEGSGTTAATPGTPQPKALSKSSPGGGASPSVRGKKSANERALARAGLSAAASDAAGNFGSRYVIVYVPVAAGASSSGADGRGKPAGAGSGGGGGGGGGFGGFRGRKGQSGGVVSSNSSGDGDSATAASTATSSSQHSAAHSAALPPGPVSHTSKEVKELYHKLVKDFPDGRTVILGTLLDGSPPSAVSPLKNQEWKAFLHNLGGAVVDGFAERVRRYDEELRRLDSRRAAFVRKWSRDGGGAGGSPVRKGVDGRPPPIAGRDASGSGDGGDAGGFDLSHFFLVKESLAFTYEQMQLFEEARLQYEELDAFLPEDAWRTLARSGGRGQRRRLRPDVEEEDDEGDDEDRVRDLAEAGDAPAFRAAVRASESDLRPTASRHVSSYVHARASRLSFRMRAPVEALRRAAAFVARSHGDRLAEADAAFRAGWKEGVEGAGVDCPKEEILKRREELVGERVRTEARAEAWALTSCWDVRCATGSCFAFASTSPQRRAGSNGGRVDASATAAATGAEVEVARCLAELLEFGMLRLMRLGDLALSGSGGARANPVRRAMTGRPADTLRPWRPWRELRRGLSGDGRAKPRSDSVEDDDGVRWPDVLSPDGAVEDVPPWLRAVASAPSPYERAYLALAGEAARLNRLAGRRRAASRLEDQRAEVLIARGDHAAAAEVLSRNGAASGPGGTGGSATTRGGWAGDQWTRAHCWRLFRLACCQRASGDVLAYLETLTRGFDPRLRGVAPERTASLFQRDLEAIVTDAAVSEPRWGAFPFLETELSVATGTTGKSEARPLPFLRRKLARRLCGVGNVLRFALGVRSHLPRPIAVQGVRLYLVALERYEEAYRRDGAISEDDAFRILDVRAPITIEPGENEFSFEWQPMTPDTYVLATVAIHALLRRPMIGLDVRPSEPTQTIELNPLFLIPGHVQNVRLVFHSGSDVITEGRVTLSCSRGLVVVPPRTDPSRLEGAWSDECVIPLDACGPGRKVVVTTLVKSSTLGPDGDAEGGAEASVQTLRARVETRYRQECYEAVMAQGEEPESDPMATLLEAMVTTLDRPALAVDDAGALAIGDDRIVVDVAVRCNSPVPFYVKEWHLDLPPPLAVEEDGDLNKGLFRHPIPEGETLLFGFRCARTDITAAGGESRCERPLLRVVLQDDFGKTFLQVLPLDLDDIYRKLRKEDVYDELYMCTAELTCAADEGTVGHPVPFVYDLNLQSLVTPRQRRRASIGGGGASVSGSTVVGCPMLYTIVSDGSDWIVSGKVQGLIRPSPGADALKLHFRGIPTQSGILRSFPELFLEYLPSDGSGSPAWSSSPPITVQCKNPDYFRSFAYTTSLSLAVPATLEEF
ncbi:hypothetical protein ACHAWF_011321 [Thalassiosira exigua]